jgi:ribosomal protein S12 methylthiotransferase accessory factor
MYERPAFDPRYRVTIVPGDGVFLASDRRGTDLLSDDIYGRVAALIDGSRTSYEIAEALEPEMDLSISYYALLQLGRRGYLCDAENRPPAVEPASARDVASLAELFGSARARLVIAGDYLEAELGEVNRQAHAHGYSWILAKIVGEEVWLGPVFIPGETACWCCLAQRHRTLYPVEAYLDQRRGVSTVIAEPAAVSRDALTRMAEAIQRETDRLGVGVMVRFDVITGESSFEVIDRRPQCPACGDPTMYRRRLEGRFDLACSRRAVMPPTAVAATISRVSSSSDELIHVYIAAPAAIYDAGNAAMLKAALRYRCVGSGVTSRDAMRSVIAETIERYSGVVHGDEPRLRASLDSLGGSGIHPNTCMLYSDAQYASRRSPNDSVSPMTMVPEPFDAGAPVEWTPVWSLTKREPRMLPTAFLYRGAHGAPGAEMCVADTNGCAAGMSLRDAIVRGFLELVERDSIALWWYRQLHCAAVDLDSLEASYCRDLRRAYRAMGRELWVLDITTDLNVPAYAAVSCVTGGASRGREIIFGFGAHFDPERAVTHAATEMNQLVASLGSDAEAPRSSSPELASWIATATLDGNAHLSPHGTTDLRGPRDGCDSDEDVERCRDIVERRGLEFLVLDQSRADVALPVVKVVVPGLRPATSRFAAGRLYMADARAAATSGAPDEQHLNPVPFFL